ncbi:MAG: DUF488 domain-containing protein [Methylovirgula sp.]
MLHCKRVYDPSESGDGDRVLVDRLWPRGLKRELAAIDEWLKDVAPSHELRKWYGHRPELWPEFQLRYRQELARPEAAEGLARLRGMAKGHRLTLLTATRNLAESHASVLKSVLQGR